MMNCEVHDTRPATEEVGGVPLCDECFNHASVKCPECGHREFGKNQSEDEVLSCPVCPAQWKIQDLKTWMFTDFKRTTFVSGGADPTICVKWTHTPTGDALTEFQTVVVASGALKGNEALFEVLENVHRFDEALREEVLEEDPGGIWGGE